MHPQVIKAINMSVEPVDVNALGVMEYFTITAAVYGADAAVKAAEVDLMDVRLGTGTVSYTHLDVYKRQPFQRTP